MKKKLLCCLLTLTTVTSFCACGKKTAVNNVSSNEQVESTDQEKNNSNAEAENEQTEEVVDTSNMSYEELSTYLYEQNLGEFNEAYTVAKEATTISERYALMAVAEAKLMESGVMLPLTSKGGLYQITRVAPRTRDFVLWGSDQDRFHQNIVCTELIKAEDYNEMKAKWFELKGTGTYEEYVKSYLTDKGYTIKDTYNMAYPSDPTNWDVLATSRAADTDAIINTYDGLMEYDVEGVLQPALAESYTVSDDGLTYTFKLREGEWVDSQGRKVADILADDFVAGMQHMMDAQGGLEYLVEGVIVNASEYISGEMTDFAQVGVKAVDDHTVQYTLTQPCSYFMTLLGYSVFAPMSRTYYTSQGGKFGAEYDSAAADYAYAKDSNSIAYCGPYLVTNATEKNTIVFKANPSYWNKDNINIKTLTWLYNEGTDVTKTYNDVKAGVLDLAALNTSTLKIAKDEGIFDQFAYVADTDATTYSAFYNINRAAFANVNDATMLISTQTEEEAARTNKAMNNVHFRRAMSFGLDRGTYNAQQTGEDLKYTSLRNSYTPWNFVALPEEVTIDINGTATTFPADTVYGVIVQAQLDADGVAIKAYDASADNGNGSGDGYDGWYNPENAVAELEIAIQELAEQGVTVDTTTPIQIDLPYPSNSEVFTNKATAYKKSIENSLGGKVVINLVESKDTDGWYYAGYYTDYGYEGNYDIYDLSGWGPDYGDPATYLDTFLPDFAGYMIKCIGLF